MTVSATVTTLAYCLWAFEQPRVTADGLVMLSIIPFVLRRRGAGRRGTLVDMTTLAAFRSFDEASCCGWTAA